MWAANFQISLHPPSFFHRTIIFFTDYKEREIHNKNLVRGMPTLNTTAILRPHLSATVPPLKQKEYIQIKNQPPRNVN